MSATLDAGKFQKYFDDAPLLVSFSLSFLLLKKEANLPIQVRSW